MAEFGENGVVRGPSSAELARAYSSAERPKMRNILLACFLCGIAASILVALIAAAIAFVFSSVFTITGQANGQLLSDGGFYSGAFVAVMMAAFNWYLFYIVVPITWIVLLLSIGRFPRRGIRDARAYYRWGGIWGAILVGGTTAIFGGAMSGFSSAAIGAGLTGIFIGGLAGVICAALFLAIVRPERQIADIATDVF